MIRCGVLVLLAVCLAGTPALARPAEPAPEVLTVGADQYLKYTLPTADGPPVEYYISKTEQPSPLVVYIQGSGCTPAFIEMQPGVYASTVFSLTTTAHRGKYAVMIVNKPYALKRYPRPAGAATDCTADFNQFFTLESWLDQVDTAYRHALSRPWVDAKRSLIIGISEGATVASALGRRNPKVTDIALVGGSGPGQLFDMVALAYRSQPDDAGALSALAELDTQVSAIRADPDSATEFAWGHPYRRWSSFFRSSSVENLKASRARVYLVSGMADQSVPILSTEVIYSELTAAGRDVRIRRLPNAGHDLLPVGADFSQSFPQLESEFRRITDWFDAGFSK